MIITYNKGSWLTSMKTDRQIIDYQLNHNVIFDKLKARILCAKITQYELRCCFWDVEGENLAFSGMRGCVSKRSSCSGESGQIVEGEWGCNSTTSNFAKKLGLRIKWTKCNWGG
jgi:hypothetical protein